MSTEIASQTSLSEEKDVEKGKGKLTLSLTVSWILIIGVDIAVEPLAALEDFDDPNIDKSGIVLGMPLIHLVVPVI